MIGRRIRNAGVRLIEAALSKTATDPIFNPTLAGLKAKKTKELNGTVSAIEAVPKVVSTPLS